MHPIVVYGAGGLGREVRQLLSEINARQPSWEFQGFVVTDPSALGDRDSKDEVVGDEGWLQRQPRGLAVALAIGTPQARSEVAARLAAGGDSLAFPNLIHQTAIAGGQLRIGKGNIICANSVLTVGIVLGDFNHIGVSCTIGHEARLGSYCVANPGCSISGGVSIGDSVLVGTNATILQYLSVGDGATVGAGAVVTKDVPEGCTVVGVPAKIINRPAPESGNGDKA
jgi:sugar O-acyltransferase (sialic acid O-acetyltransferase NeuD family)